jgi:RNA polymerase sigma-70 factor (ECF subfamily)
MMNKATTPDLAAALASLAETPDPEAWAFVLESIGSEIESLCGRLTGDAELAKDSLQDTLLQIRDHAGNFRLRPDDHDPGAAARRWVLRVAANTAIKLLTSQARMRRRHERAGAEEQRVQEGPSERMERNDDVQALRMALAELPEAQRSAIILHHLSGLEFTDVAAELRCPIGTAKTHTARGLERMRGILERRGFALSLAAIASGITSLPATASEFSVAQAATLLTAPAKAAASIIPTTGSLIMSIKVGVVLATVVTASAITYIKSSDAEFPPGIQLVKEVAPDFTANAAVDGNNMKQIIASLIATSNEAEQWVVIPDGMTPPITDPHSAKLVTAATFEHIASATGVGSRLFVSRFNPVTLPPARLLAEIKAKPNIDWAAGFALDWAIPNEINAGRIVIAPRTIVTDPVTGQSGIFFGAGDGSVSFMAAESNSNEGHRTEGADGKPITRTVFPFPVPIQSGSPYIRDTIRDDDIFSDTNDLGDAGTPGKGSPTRAWLK